MQKKKIDLLTETLLEIKVVSHSTAKIRVNLIMNYLIAKFQILCYKILFLKTLLFGFFFLNLMLALQLPIL